MRMLWKTTPGKGARRAEADGLAFKQVDEEAGDTLEVTVPRMSRRKIGILPRLVLVRRLTKERKRSQFHRDTSVRRRLPGLPEMCGKEK